MSFNNKQIQTSKFFKRETCIYTCNIHVYVKKNEFLSISICTAIVELFQFEYFICFVFQVYTTFNRAGLSSSYKSSIRHVDQICQNFDQPVRNWANRVASHYTKKLRESAHLGN